MRLSRRRRREMKPGSRHLSLSATDAEWDAVREKARRRGLSIARYLVGLAERDGEDEPGPWMVLTADEQREMLAALREMRAHATGPAPPSPEATAPTAIPAAPSADGSPRDTADPAPPDDPPPRAWRPF